MPFRHHFTLLFCLLAASRLHAGTRYVNLNNPTPAAPYTSWATAATNIQDAVDAATNSDTVLVTNGVYQSGTRIVYGTLKNRVAVSKPLTLQSVNGPAVTIIQGNPSVGDNAVRCVYMTNGAVLAGFTLTNGATRSAGDPATEQSGGAVWSEASTCVVSNCVLIGNSSANFGGGAYQGTLTNCAIGRNLAYRGGGTYGANLNNCQVFSNSTSNPFQLDAGGGSYGGTLNGCTVYTNFSVNGGGVFGANLNYCTIISNRAGTSGGGGVSGGCTLTFCSVVNNSTTYSGAGSYGCTLYNCLVSGNSTAVAGFDGGGGYNGAMYNCIVISNHARGDGGGAFRVDMANCLVAANTAIHGSGGAREGVIVNSTITGNSGGSGGGVQGSWLNNSIVYGNTAPSGSNYFSAEFQNAVMMNYCCSSPLPPDGVGNTASSPLFVNSVNDFHLQSNSPCIGTGNNGYISLPADLDGRPRIVSGTVDMGAYEFMGVFNSWLQQYGLMTNGSADYSDTDGDTMSNWQEWLAGTIPNDPASRLLVLKPVPNGSNVVVTWQSVSNRAYYLQRSTNVFAQPAFLPLATNIQGKFGTTSYTNTNVIGPGPYFYRVGVQ